MRFSHLEKQPGAVLGNQPLGQPLRWNVQPITTEYPYGVLLLCRRGSRGPTS
jgi:hypothetical protein